MIEPGPTSGMAPRPPEVRALDKSPDAFRTISEVAEDLDVPQHVLRFWETRFPQIKPLKRGGGRRYYRPDDVDLLRGIRELLYGRGYTIRGVQRILKQDGLRFVQAIGRGERTIAQPSVAADDVSEADEAFGSAHEPEPAVPQGPEPAGSEADALGHAGKQGRSDLDHGMRRDPSSRAGLGPRAPTLSPADVRRLRAALDELLECGRVLAALSLPDDSGPDRSA
jgi:DNA-binding transcriptional MerR regulator